MKLRIAFFAWLAFAATALAEQPQELARRFALAYFSNAPGSVVEVQTNHTATTSVGTYYSFSVKRTTIIKDRQADQIGMLLDPASGSVSVGLVFPLPATPMPVTPDVLPAFAEQVIPQILRQAMSTEVRVRWPGIPTRMAAVVPLEAEVSTGYGWIHMPIAVSADGRWILVGPTWPLDRDPRAVRRDILAKAPIQWDPGHEHAIVKVVEFSDYECPACKAAWTGVKPIFESFGEKLRHGIVNFPLVQNHPWSFRAAVAGSCIDRLWPDQLIPFKEEMYRLQSTLTVETVDEGVKGFLDQRQLDKRAFFGCYMKDRDVDEVLSQLELGHRLGVLGTPTYFVNGEPMPFGENSWIKKRIEAIIENGGRPEGAADIVPDPPTPTPPPPKRTGAPGSQAATPHPLPATPAPQR